MWSITKHRFALALALASALVAGCAGSPTEPTGPSVANAPSVEAEDPRYDLGVAHLDWRVENGDGLAFEVHRRHAGQPWKVRGTISPDPDGRMSFEDGTITRREPYTYRIQMPDGVSPEFQGAVLVTLP